MSVHERAAPFAIVPIEAALDHRLTAMQYRVLIAILSFRNRNSDTCYPRREKIAERTGYAILTISKVTSSLVDLGWLEKTGRGGRSSPSSYRVTVPETIPGAGTVLEVETVPGSETVPESGTVPGSASKTVSGSASKTVSGSDTRIEQTIEQTNEQRKETRGRAAPCPDGISSEVWRDFLAVRKAKRAPITELAMRAIAREAAKCGLTLEQALVVCIERNWQAFRADWHAEQGRHAGNAASPSHGRWVV